MAARILIIEDNQTNLDLMNYLLRAFGYLPLTARDGREGLETAAREMPDLIICDLEMPGMNGYEAGGHLKSNPQLRNIPLIAVTAYAMVGDRDRVLSAGFDGYIAKPINPETFVSQIEGFLDPGKRSGRSPAKAAAAAAAPSPCPAKRARVLVVDDSPVNLSLICSTLEPSGYEVVAVNTPEEAMEVAHRTSFDLIVSDLHMPRQSGLDFLQRIKADPRLQSVPFVLFSTSSSGSLEGARERALALGAEVFISRPIEPQALLARIEACLQQAPRK